MRRREGDARAFYDFLLINNSRASRGQIGTTGYLGSFTPTVPGGCNGEVAYWAGLGFDILKACVQFWLIYRSSVNGQSCGVGQVHCMTGVT